MEIPDFIMEMVLKELERDPDINYVSVRTDKLGGWFMDYFRKREGAEKLVEGCKEGTFEILNVED